MKRKLSEINDDEIRIISAEESKSEYRKNRIKLRYLLIVVAIIVVIGVLGINLLNNNDKNEELKQVPENNVIVNKEDTVTTRSSSPIKGLIQVVDTVINKKSVLILTPENARPRLVIGKDMLNDTSIILATQAADVRADNGQIAGTYVINGELISRGEAKAGFCSIINGELTIGIADATPLLEQALTQGGYFFRQYPLVVGGQIVENKPKGKAIRKALAEIDGKICVVISHEKLTFYDFSQLLIDVGVRNAIYLVGSKSQGFYINDKGQKVMTGVEPTSFAENVNYIIWE